MKKSEMVQHSGPSDVDEPASDNDPCSFVSTDPATTAIQASAPNSIVFPSAKTDLASDPPVLRPDASAGYSASRASRGS